MNNKQKFDYKTYKNDRAIETIKKVIYSVDTPQSLMVSACTLLGNIYSDINNPQEAFSYYQTYHHMLSYFLYKLKLPNQAYAYFFHKLVLNYTLFIQML